MQLLKRDRKTVIYYRVSHNDVAEFISDPIAIWTVLAGHSNTIYFVKIIRHVPLTPPIL